MKLVWSPETASKAYLDTVKSCKKIKAYLGAAELLSAMAAGWNAKLIVETWSYGSPIAISIGLIIAARHACSRHVCMVPDERSRSEYVKSMQDAGITPSSSSSTIEVIVGRDPQEVMERLVGVDFLVVDCGRKDFNRVLRSAKLSQKGAVLACKNAIQRGINSGFKWNGVLERGTRVVRSLFLPVGNGLDIAHIGSRSSTSNGDNGGGGSTLKKSPPGRWIKHVDQRSGEEHLFRG